MEEVVEGFVGLLLSVCADEFWLLCERCLV